MSVGPIRCAAILIALCVLPARAEPAHPWPTQPAGAESLASRVAPPASHARVPAPEGSFAAWLRGLPLRPEGAVVHLFDGGKKPRQDGVFAVLDIDVGSRDLQQCADAVMRLRAEYLWAAGCADQVAFDFTSGDRARWVDWRGGLRPVVAGSKVSWAPRGSPDASYASFRSYLSSVFTYAGSASLARELEAVADPSSVQPGDVFIQGGFPCHAVLVADVARNARGESAFLLVQSYMPAQDIHVLRNPDEPGTPWYPAREQGVLRTPEWTFAYGDLRRFAPIDCSR
jgi:hypothetical protein